MRLVIQMNRSEEGRALPILLRHSPGTVLPGPAGSRLYLLSEAAARALRASGVEFTEVSREAVAASREEAGVGERV